MLGPNNDCNYLFESKAKYTRKFKKYIRCELCKYSERRADLPEDYIHCTKYSNMISHQDLTCKSSTLREEENE